MSSSAFTLPCLGSRGRGVMARPALAARWGFRVVPLLGDSRLSRGIRLVLHLVHYRRMEAWIVAIWQRIASSTGVSSPAWPSSLKSVRTVPATHYGERSHRAGKPHDGLVAHNAATTREYCWSQSLSP